jgi:hypothetical protein
MTQEDKELLIKDLCARLPYDIKCKIEMWKGYDVCTIYNINSIGYVEIVEDSDTNGVNIERIKPYLFPLSSMTEEQREELYKIGWYLDEDKIYSCFRNYDDENYKTHTDCFELINWCYKNNFDINGLIPMGLAIDATGLNVY